VIPIARVRVNQLHVGASHLGRALMKPPVFVVGCPRSGTTLLYSMFMAAGGFAVYRKETHFYHLAPGFPRVLTERTRRRLKEQYMAGYLGKVPGLAVEHFVDRALDASRTYEEVLPHLMGAITHGQEMERWVEATPTHVLYMREIERAVPDALFVHVIRDGRDCALSYDRQSWTSTLPCDRRHRVGIAALYWEFMVRAGRTFARDHQRDCLEVRFEDLIEHPRETLSQVGGFLHHYVKRGCLWTGVDPAGAAPRRADHGVQPLCCGRRDRRPPAVFLLSAASLDPALAIITSVDLIMASASSPRRSFSARTASAVITAVRD